MSLQVYNSASRKKEVFTPIDPAAVKMYVCGPTVYNLVHIGNARPVVVFDTFYRLLKSLYPSVTYARNITDVDDKIMKVAAEESVAIQVVSSRFAAEYQKDMAALNNLEPDITPYATEHIGEMIAMTQQLIAKGHAYEAQGHVLFAVQSMADYGKLSGRSLEDMLAGARVEAADAAAQGHQQPAVGQRRLGVFGINQLPDQLADRGARGGAPRIGGDMAAEEILELEDPEVSEHVLIGRHP